MKLITVLLALEGICLSCTSYSMQNDEIQQLPKDSLKNLLHAQTLVDRAEAIVAGIDYNAIRAHCKTPEEQMDYINREKSKATVVACQAVPFATAVINDNNKNVSVADVVEIFKRIEVIVK